MSSKYDKYLEVIESTVKPILLFVPRGIPNYTDHGLSHSKRVIQYCHKIFVAFKETNIELNEIEKFLISSSAWLHDIGNLIGRKKHPEKSCEFLDYLNKKYFFIDPYLINLIKIVIETHSERCLRISSIPRFKSYNDVKIRLRLVCALFRLADECDIDFRRAPKIVYDLIQKDMKKKMRSKNKRITKKYKESNDYWLSHQTIRNIEFEKKSKKIIILVYDANLAQKAIESIKREMKILKPIFDEEGFPYNEIEIEEIYTEYTDYTLYK